jgi:biotin carboxyl carrier protein
MGEFVKYIVHWNDRRYEVDVSGTRPDYRVCIDGEEVRVDAHTLGDPSLLSILLDRASFLAHVVPSSTAHDHWDVSTGGKFARLEGLDELSSMAKQMHAAQAGGAFVLQAPMPGLVLDVKVAAGDQVQIGTPLVIMEAMKMQNELVSEINGTVQEILTTPQTAVESGARLMEIVADES